MEMATASFWLDALALGAVLVWAVGAWFVRRTRAALQEPLTGEARVPIAPADVLAAVARRLAVGGSDVLRGAAIDVADARQVAWHSDAIPRHRGTVVAERAGDGARVLWQLTGDVRLLGARLVVVAGAVWIVALYLVLRTYALPSEHGGARGQVFQMVQAVHLLWPPFVLAGVARMLRRRLATEVARVVQNAPFAAPAPVAN